MINVENVKRWIKALRSGKFKQGKFGLCSINKETGETLYCCLGVATVLAGCEEVEDRASSENPYKEYIQYKSGVDDEGNPYVESGALPVKAKEWLGVDEENPFIPSQGCSLAMMNDDNDLTFEQIADILEKEYVLPNE